MENLPILLDLEEAKNSKVVRFYSICEVCNSQYLTKKYTVRHNSRFICRKCNAKEKLRSRTLEQKALTKQKHEQTCLLKYNYKHTTQNPEIKAKIRKTVQQRYGGNAPACSLEVQAKARVTCLARYGTPFAQQNLKIKARSMQTWKDRDPGYKNEMKKLSKQMCNGLEKNGINKLIEEN